VADLRASADRIILGGCYNPEGRRKRHELLELGRRKLATRTLHDVHELLCRTLNYVLLPQSQYRVQNNASGRGQRCIHRSSPNS
jgi:hypothetical protein